MKIQSLTLSLSLCMFVIFIFSSCNEHESFKSPTAPSIKDDKPLPKVNPNAYYAGYGSLWYIPYYQFDHYSAKPGKTLGIWPNQNTGPSDWTLYRTKWGFNQSIFTSTAYGAQGGYSNANCLVTIPNYASYQSAVLASNNCNYYIDEPIEQGRFNYDQCVEVSNFIRDNRSGSKLFFGSYRPEAAYVSIVWYATNNTYIMPDPYDGDQRTQWTNYHNLFGPRNISNWIHSFKDKNEFSNLIGHANNLGINSLWLFIGDDGDPAQIPYFCDIAWRMGWLGKFNRRWNTVYQCDCPGGCNSLPPSDCWTNLGPQPTDIFEEVFP